MPQSLLKMSEKKLLNDIMIAHSKRGGRLFRNNVGKGWAGKSKMIERDGHVYVNRGDVVIKSARRLHYGLCVGSSDLIGWTPIIITEQMIGKILAVFTAVEGKTGKLTATQKQKDFISAVNDQHGIAVVIRSVEELKEKI